VKKLVETHASTVSYNGNRPPAQSGSLTGIALCALAFILCILVNIAPLDRLAGANQLFALPTNTFLIAIGAWLPVNFGLTSNLRASQMSTHILLFVSLVALEFIIYGICLWQVQRQPMHGDNRRVLKLIWLGVIIAGLVFVLTPAFLSHDAFVYAGYGRLLVVHHTNPYFTPLSVYPQDPFFRLDDWRDATAAYGPLWLGICALGALIAGDNPLQYILLYRTLGLIAHLVNVLLVITILRSMKHSPRTVATGALLYAWNPLALQESCLGGHNDTFMVTLMLLGLLFCIQAEQRSSNPLTSLRGYLLPLIAFTSAVLIKFTSAPLLALFLILLVRKALYSTTSQASLRRFRTLQWRRALMTVIPAGLISVGYILLCYAPFWIGYSINDIVNSFVSPPSANLSFGSIFSAIFKWVHAYGLPAQNWLAIPLQMLSMRQSWQYINFATVAIVMLAGIVWLWHVPTTRTLTLATLGVLGALLIVTPWFFPWYVIWLVGLAAVCLPAMQERIVRALVAFALAFSASAHFIYYFRGYAPLGDWIGLTFLCTVGPPILVLLISLCLPVSRKGKMEKTDYTQISPSKH